MTTLITTFTSGGCIRRCDATCHNAQHSTCACICGGMNHGKGSKQAAINTHNHYKKILETWTKEKKILSSFQLSLDNLALHGEKN